jgi:hypothetical protein
LKNIFAVFANHYLQVFFILLAIILSFVSVWVDAKQRLQNA